MAASGTFDCFRECIGKKVVGVLRDVLPEGRSDLNRGTKTLVFDDGTGLTIGVLGTFWRESARNIQWAVHAKRRELEENGRDVRELLVAAGLPELPDLDDSAP